MKRIIGLFVSALLGIAGGFPDLEAQGTAFTYQGSLTENSAALRGNYDLRFTLYDAGTNGVIVAGPATNSATAVSNGLFTATLDFGTNAFNGATRWLQIDVRTNGAGSFTSLSPRRAVTPTPYAILAASVPMNSIGTAQLQASSVNSSKIAFGAVGTTHLSQNSVGTFVIADGSITAADIAPSTIWPGFLGIQSVGNGQLALDAVSSGKILDGTITSSDVAANTFWQTLGNAGTTPGTHFLGTTDNKALEFKVNGERALRLQPTGDSPSSPDGISDGAPNIIAGSSANTIDASVVGGTISGGGATNYFGESKSNYLTGDFSTIAGGAGNIMTGGAFANTISGGYNNGMDNVASSAIGGGEDNYIGTYSERSVISGGYRNAIGSNSLFASIAGGISNDIEDESNGASIGGGAANRVRSIRSHVGGGGGNVIATNARLSVIAGGFLNTIIGDYGMIPGGSNNVAGTLSFAAGRTALATNMGTFIWADAQNVPFGSTSNNQFLVRAAGGVGVNTPNPQAHLHVLSPNNPTTVRVQSSGTPGFGRVEFVSDPQGSGSEWRPGFIQSTDNGGFTGGLAFNVNGSGIGNRFATQEVMRVVNGRVGILTNNPAYALHVVGTVTATTFNPPSDRNLKENFKPVNPREVLDKVTALPISHWNFKGIAEEAHVGPMAQDFHAAFALGSDDRHIATVDADGVALAAIQGLNQKLEEQLRARDREISELKKLVQELANQMQSGKILGN